MVETQNTTYPQPHCPNCGSPLRLIAERKDWFCDNCKVFPKTSAEISKIKNIGTKEGNRKFWIYYIIVFMAIFGWFLVDGLITRDPFEKSLYLYGTIILLIAAVFSVILFKVIMKRK